MNSTCRKFRELSFDPKYYDQVINKQKTSTVRYGILLPTEVEIKLNFGFSNDVIKAKISKIDFSYLFDELNEKVARTDGFETVKDLKKALSKHYPFIESDSKVTVIYFNILMV